MTEMNPNLPYAALMRAMRLSGAQGGLLTQAVAGQVGLHPTDLECLDVINLNGAATAGELARASGLTTGAITGVIDRLERSGYVTRERDPGDRRRVIVRPNPAAGQRIGPLYAGLAHRMAVLCAGYDPASLDLLLGFFTRATEILRDETERLRDAVPHNNSQAVVE